ncbi:uncharacterized protein LOC143181683 [Calliopsis andreniformis]|uniref:uncharacterized protein LOC143181683 n=1 Tax=Calliopsis andreniformis TaxID=337506 RepID=UPI003FCEB30D
MAQRGALYLLLVTLTLGGGQGDTKYFVKMRTNASELFKTRSNSLRVLEEPIAATATPSYSETRSDARVQDERMISDFPRSEEQQKNAFEASTFNPDVLNRFLEEFASKIKTSTTEKYPKYPFKLLKPTEPFVLEIDDLATSSTSASYDQDTKLEEDTMNSTSTENGLSEALNDTLKRNKYYGANSYEDRNGWVTLEAIPWSKSKISKWQATPSTQRPWPDAKPWEKPGVAKPWTADYSIRPIYENNKPWYQDKPKPNWPETNDKPWHKPTPRPTYYPDKLSEENQAQKWPPERPSWNKYTERPNSDIITDSRPANFPGNWNRPQPTKPTYQFVDRYSDKNQEDSNDWHDFPNRFDDRLRPSTDRPGFSQYQYVNNHPQSYPGNGDGQWILLSTNRGYSKTRQRSIKMDAENGTKSVGGKKEEHDPAIPVMTSKRQVRLTVLPSINGTNTTTSHGGLLEVEKTFKSVDQSRKEYEMERQTLPTILRKRPIRNTMSNQPSSSAVLAAVGAGILPATMAMMIPMILGRRKRELSSSKLSLLDYQNSLMNIRVPTNIHEAQGARLR